MTNAYRCAEEKRQEVRTATTAIRNVSLPNLGTECAIESSNFAATSYFSTWAILFLSKVGIKTVCNDVCYTGQKYILKP
jgi:hypothetical protein